MEIYNLYFISNKEKNEGAHSGAIQDVWSRRSYVREKKKRECRPLKSEHPLGSGGVPRGPAEEIRED